MRVGFDLSGIGATLSLDFDGVCVTFGKSSLFKCLLICALDLLFGALSLLFGDLYALDLLLYLRRQDDLSKLHG